jgi:hypothetical protein
MNLDMNGPGDYKGSVSQTTAAERSARRGGSNLADAQL